MPYAIVNDRGRRYTVQPGAEVRIDLRRDAEPGSRIVFDAVELVSSDAGIKVGAPTVSGVTVVGEVKGMIQGEKVVVFRYRRRKSSRKKSGHRARYTRVAIQSIEGA